MSTIEDRESLPREAVGVFHNSDAMQAAVDELLISGFNHADLSVLADEKALAAKPSLVWRRSKDLENESGAASGAYVSPESIGDAQGALVGALVYVGAVSAAAFVIGSGGLIGGAVIASAVAGGIGGGIGTMLARILQHRRAEALAAQIERGGLLLWIRTRTFPDEERAIKILRRHGGEDVHVHDIASGALPRDTGSKPPVTQ